MPKCQSVTSDESKSTQKTKLLEKFKNIPKNLNFFIQFFLEKQRKVNNKFSQNKLNQRTKH